MSKDRLPTMTASRSRCVGLLLLLLALFCSIQFTNAESYDQKFDLVLDYSNRTLAERSERALSKIQQDDWYAFETRSISIKGHSSLLNVTQLNDALAHHRGPLEFFDYDMDHPIERSTLEALEDYHEDTRMYYHLNLQPWYSFDYGDEYLEPNAESDAIEHTGVGLWNTWSQRIQKTQEKTLRDIVESQNLYSLKTKIVYGSESNYRDLPLVYDILTSCPNLRGLDLSIEWGGGCVVSSYPWAFDFTKNNKSFPPLEVLKLSGYRMYSFENGEYSKWRSSASIWDYFTGYLKGQNGFFDYFEPHINYKHAEEPYSLYAWLERMDWSKLRVLELDSASPEVLEAISPALGSLEHFELSHGSGCVADTLPQFLGNLTQPLQRLRIEDVWFDDYRETGNCSSCHSASHGLLPSLAPFGTNLSSLAITERESLRSHYCFYENSPKDLCPERRGMYYDKRPFLNESELLQLGKQNPWISSFEFDVARFAPVLEDNTTWTIDHNALRQAALLPELMHLHVNVESPDFTLVRSGQRGESLYENIRYANRTALSDAIFYHDPTFNRMSVPALFKELNELRRSNDLEPLHQLVIKVGRWDSLDQDWGMMGPPDLLVGKWTCKGVIEQDCFGGNDLIGYRSPRYDGGMGIQDPYSQDWSLPDKIDEYWDQESEPYLVGKF